MGYWKNARMQMEKEEEQEKGLYPVGYVIENLKDYQKELVEKEVDSLRELNALDSDELKTGQKLLIVKGS